MGCGSSQPEASTDKSAETPKNDASTTTSPEGANQSATAAGEGKGANAVENSSSTTGATGSGSGGVAAGNTTNPNSTNSTNNNNNNNSTKNNKDNNKMSEGDVKGADGTVYKMVTAKKQVPTKSQQQSEGAAALGPDWRGPVRDKKTGREYYFNKVTNETKFASDGLWQKPAWADKKAGGGATAAGLLKTTNQGAKLKESEDGNLAKPITHIRDTYKK